MKTEALKRLRMADQQSVNKYRNLYNLNELAGAFGDLGTLVPFILIYINVLHYDPIGLFFTFGLLNIVTGMYYRTPIPVQPMKGIATFSATHPGQITHGMISGAGIFSGIFWLVLSLTGMIEHFVKTVDKHVVKGILIGLGLSFISQGAKMAVEGPFVAGITFLIFLLLKNSKRVPAMLVILVFGVFSTFVTNPAAIEALGRIRPALTLPDVDFRLFTFDEFLNGVLILALPQLIITLGNGILGLVAEHNKIFPEQEVSSRKISFSTGLMNLFTPVFGGVPMCHGAGGMAGHVRFGARSGGATVMLGILLLLMALFFGQSLSVILPIFPVSVLGVVMILAGTVLMNSAYSSDWTREEFLLVTCTAGLTLWHAGAGLFGGILLSFIFRRIKI